MRYVGNMRKNMPVQPENRMDKAVFPPGSIIPEKMAEDAVMYEQNPMTGQQGFQRDLMQQRKNVQPEAENALSTMNTNDTAARANSENYRVDGDNLRGLMDYEGMEFPLPSGSVLRRYNDEERFTGSVEDPRNFSPANGLGGRPMDTNVNSLTGMGRNPLNNTVPCGSNMRLSDIMCMYAGEHIDVEFMFGADTYVKKSGILSGAGMNFIVLTDAETMQKTICDLTDMKFVNISKQG